MRSIVVALATIGCGRVGFDVLDGRGTPADAATSDGSPARCLGVADTCGPTGTSPCCSSPLVPGGTFYRSYDVGTDNMYIDMTNPATVSDFRLDTYEITVGRFRQFVAAGKGTQMDPPAAGAGAHPTIIASGWDPSWNASLAPDTATLVTEFACDASFDPTWTDARGANESLAMNCITWFEAMAFCAWDAGFLPTDAEWNYAAAGGDEQRAYPWSSPPTALIADCTFANYGAPCVGTIGAINRVGNESPKGDGRWGQADLGGNAYEWTLDWYATPYDNPCEDCAHLTLEANRVFRGGGFTQDPQQMRGATRGNDFFADPSNIGHADVGARCARP